MRGIALPGRLIVAGALYGDCDRLEAVAEAAANLGCDTVLQLGDCGVYDDLGRLKRATDILSAAGVRLVFLGGPRDHWGILDDAAGDLQPPVDLSEHVTYLPRGTRGVFGAPGAGLGSGVGFVAVGGGTSPDRGDRREHVDWFARETPGEDVLCAVRARAAAMPPGGVVVLHDAPSRVNDPGWSADEVEARWGATEMARSWRHREDMSAVCDAARPALVLWASRGEATKGNMVLADGRNALCVGVAACGEDGSVGHLDTNRTSSMAPLFPDW